jgi:hypothetical protein
MRPHDTLVCSLEDDINWDGGQTGRCVNENTW